MRFALCLAALLVLSGASWIDPHAKAREASRLYDSGDFAAATQKYNEALTDDPDSFRLQYNRAASLYRENKLEEAAAAFARAPAVGSTDPAGPAEVAYNVGNTKYRLGAAVAESDAKQALGFYAEALAAYRRAMGANPDDADAKFNHELVAKKMEELRRKLEEQQQEQEQQSEQQQEQQPQNQQQDQQQQPQQDQQSDQPQNEQDQAEPQEGQPDQEQGEQRQEDEPQQAQPSDQQQPQQEAQQKDAAEPPEPQAGTQAEGGDQTQPAGSAASGERREGEMTQREATALLDAARDQEVSPEEIIERMQGAAVLDPSQDW